MEIKACSESDEVALKAFKDGEWCLADAEHFGDNPPDFSEHSFTFLAKEDDIIVGQIRGAVSQGIAKIESLLVGSGQQGRGIGRELVTSLETAIRATGAHKIELET